MPYLLFHPCQDFHTGDFFNHFHIVFFHHTAFPMIQDNSFDRNIPAADIFAGSHHSVDCPQSRVGDDKDGQAEPSDNIFQIIHRFSSWRIGHMIPPLPSIVT